MKLLIVFKDRSRQVFVCGEEDGPLEGHHDISPERQAVVRQLLVNGIQVVGTNPGNNLSNEGKCFLFLLLYRAVV